MSRRAPFSDEEAYTALCVHRTGGIAAQALGHPGSKAFVLVAARRYAKANGLVYPGLGQGQKLPRAPRSAATTSSGPIAPKARVPKAPTGRSPVAATIRQSVPPQPIRTPKPVPIEHFTNSDLSKLCQWCEDPAPEAKPQVFTLVKVQLDSSIRSCGSIQLCEKCWKRFTVGPEAFARKYKAKADQIAREIVRELSTA